MRPTAHFLCKIAALVVVMASCHRGSQPTVTARPEDSAGISMDHSIALTRQQFTHAGMELGGLGEFVAADIIASSGYVDVPVENRCRISSVIGGFVSVADLLPGDRVKKGQVLATLENIEYLKLQQDFLEAREKLVYLKSVYEAQSALSQENVSSRKNYLQAQADYLAMQANYESLAKQLLLS